MVVAREELEADDKELSGYALVPIRNNPSVRIKTRFLRDHSFDFDILVLLAPRSFLEQELRLESFSWLSEFDTYQISWPRNSCLWVRMQTLLSLCAPLTLR